MYIFFTSLSLSCFHLFLSHSPFSHPSICTPSLFPTSLHSSAFLHHLATQLSYETCQHNDNLPPSPCNMNEPNTINTEKRGWRNATFEGRMNKLLPKGFDKVSYWATQWKVEGGRVRKSSCYGLVVTWVTRGDLVNWLWQVELKSLLYPFYKWWQKKPTTGCPILRKANGWTAEVEGCCSGIKLWTKTHVANCAVENAVCHLLVCSILWKSCCVSAGEGRSHTANGRATSSIQPKNLLHCTKPKSIKWFPILEKHKDMRKTAEQRWMGNGLLGC